MKEEIRLAIDRAEQSEKQTKKAKEKTMLAKEEAQRLRKILEEHGWSE